MGKPNFWDWLYAQVNTNPFLWFKTRAELKQATYRMWMGERLRTGGPNKSGINAALKSHIDQYIRQYGDPLKQEGTMKETMPNDKLVLTAAPAIHRNP